MSEKVDITFWEEHKLMDIEKIFVLKRNELTKDWRKLHNEKLQDFYSSLNTTMVIKSRLMKWVVINTGRPRRNVKYFGRVFLMLNYTDITQNTYIQS